MEDYSKKRNKVSTQDGYQGVIDRNIIPLLGRKKVHDVKRPDIAGLMEKLAYKPTEANKTFGVLRKMFNLPKSASARTARIQPPRPDVPAGQGNPAHRGRGNGADLPPVGETGGGGAGELRHPVGDPAAIRVCGAALRNLPARMELAGLREPARGVARQSKGWRHFKPMSGCFCWLPACRTQVGTHGIRHRSTTDIANSGVPTKVGMKLTGHKTVAMFMHYVHTEDKPVREAAELASRRQAITGARQLAEAVA